MPTIQDYMSGKICEQVLSALQTLETSEDSLRDTEIGKNLLNRVNKAKPKKLSIDEAIRFIRESQQCAIGERVCRSLHEGTPLTESVFLDELAAGMVEAGKARFVNKEEAVDNIMKYRKQPMIISKVSDKYSEICPTWVKKCLFWNMEKHNLKCILR